MMTPRNYGFRKIDNDIFKAMITAGLPGAGYQVVLTIIDRTLGFRKDSGYKEKAGIPLSYFEKVTGLSRQSVRLAIKQAEKSHLITTERDSTKTTTYALNTDTSQWLTRQQNHPSKLGNKITPDWETKSPYTRKLAMPSCMPAKQTLKETLKERGYDKEKDTISYQGGNEGTGNELKDSALKRVVPVNPDEDSTLKGDTLTHGDAIKAFLHSHGQSSPKVISEGTGIASNMVSLTLHNGKGKRFVHFPELRAWEVLTATEVKSSKDTPLTDTERLPTDDNGNKIEASNRERVIAYLSTHGPSPVKDLVRELGLTAKQVTKVLDRYRDKYFYHYKEKHLWGNTSGLPSQRDIKPVSDSAFLREHRAQGNSTEAIPELLFPPF